MARIRRQRDWPSPLPPKPIPGEWKEDGKETVLSCYTGFENFHVTIIFGHLYYPDKWVWTCHAIGKTEQIMPGVKTVEEAKIVALTAVCAWFIEAMTALDRVRRKTDLV